MAESKLERLKRRRKIEALSWGLTFRLTDLVLITLFLGLTLSMPSKHASKFWAKTFRGVKKSIDEEKIKRAFYQLKKYGLAEYGKRWWLEPQITAAGKKRLAAVLPLYDSERVWDKKLYLVTYDIPEKERVKRNQLRRYLAKIGCGLLQESVWITPYNPKEVIRDYAENAAISDLILISDLGKDGQIGQEDVRDLIGRVYRLEELNQRYRELLEAIRRRKISKKDIPARFFAILKDDPQLPFELLPDGWLGETAWEKTKPLL